MRTLLPGSARLWFGLLLAPALSAAPRLALGPGEELTYRVSWAILPGAGQIDIAAQTAPGRAGAAHLRIVSTTSTRGLAHILLPFEARSESLFDAADGRLAWLTESGVVRSRRTAHNVTFDYVHHVALYTESDPPGPTRALPMPPGNPTDLILGLLKARTWNLKPGQTRDMLALFNDDFYLLTVHALHYERLSTPLGTFDTLMLEPRMEKTPPLGMFRRGSTVQVWIAQDEARLPVRFRVQFKYVGAGTATLVRYRPPGV